MWVCVCVCVRARLHVCVCVCDSVAFEKGVWTVKPILSVFCGDGLNFLWKEHVAIPNLKHWPDVLAWWSGRVVYGRWVQTESFIFFFLKGEKKGCMNHFSISFAYIAVEKTTEELPMGIIVPQWPCYMI